MTTKKEALAALALFPRFDSKSAYQTPKGGASATTTYVNVPVISDAEEFRVKARMKWNKKSSARPKWTSKLQDVANLDVHCIHASLDAARVKYYISNFERATVLKDDNKEPTMCWFKGRWIMWNGHHRLLAARLLGRKLPCILYNLDSAEAHRNFAAHKAWEKKHGDGK